MATHFSILPWKIPWTEGAWRATVHGVTKSRTRLKQLNNSDLLLGPDPLALGHTPYLANLVGGGWGMPPCSPPASASLFTPWPWRREVPRQDLKREGGAPGGPGSGDGLDVLL